jgi:hypothetical protein
VSGKGDGGTVKLDTYHRLCDLVPTMRLFGGCAENRIVPGFLTVQDMTLICAESVGFIPAWAIAKAREIVSRKCKAGRNGKEDWCIQARDWRAEIVAVHNEVKDKLVRYTRDPDGVDFFAGAKRVMAMGGADCDEMIALELALLRAIGYPVELVVVETTNAPIKGEYEHIFGVAAYEDADGSPRAIWLDPTVREKPAGWRVPESMCVREKSYAVP